MSLYDFMKKTNEQLRTNSKNLWICGFVPDLDTVKAAKDVKGAPIDLSLFCFIIHFCCCWMFFTISL